jgi:hypothetical protein
VVQPADTSASGTRHNRSRHNDRNLTIRGPLVHFYADDEGGHLRPFLLLEWVLFRELTWSWSNVERIYTYRGPRGGLHGLRIAFYAPVAQSRAGALGLRSPLDGFMVGLNPEDGEDLLSLAPSSVPREDRRGPFIWRTRSERRSQS